MTGKSPPNNVVPIGTGGGEPPRNGGRIDRIEATLNEVDKRLIVVESKLPELATKRDIDKLKIWALLGALGGSFAAIIWLARLLIQALTR